MREYDQSLVKKIQQKTYIKNIDGEDIIMKPVPDDDRECVVDPRVVETTKIKMTVKSLDRNAKFSLYGNRVRPDKVMILLQQISMKMKIWFQLRVRIILMFILLHQKII